MNSEELTNQVIECLGDNGKRYKSKIHELTLKFEIEIIKTYCRPSMLLCNECPNKEKMLKIFENKV